jgi:hypothetical protein
MGAPQVRTLVDIAVGVGHVLLATRHTVQTFLRHCATIKIKNKQMKHTIKLDGYFILL